MTREEAARRLREKAEDQYYVPRLRELYLMAAQALSEQEVVRCGECEHWRQYARCSDGRCTFIEAEHGIHKMVTDEYFFCEYGQRRIEDATDRC